MNIFSLGKIMKYDDPSVILYRWLEDNSPNDPPKIDIESIYPVEFDDDGNIHF